MHLLWLVGLRDIRGELLEILRRTTRNRDDFRVHELPVRLLGEVG